MRKNVTLLSFSDLYYELFQMKIDVVVYVADNYDSRNIFILFIRRYTYVSFGRSGRVSYHWIN